MRGLEGLRGGNARPTAGGRAETKARLGEGGRWAGVRRGGTVGDTGQNRPAEEKLKNLLKPSVAPMTICVDSLNYVIF